MSTRMSLAPTETLREAWERDGFVIVPDLFNEQDLEAMGHALEIQARKFSPGTAEFRASWRSPEFQSALIALRQATPGLTARIYDSLQSNAALKAATSKPAVLALAAELLDDEPAGLSITGQMIRLDFPRDQRNRLHWHQERSYYAMNDNGLHGAVLWAPVYDATKEMGAIQVCRGSHKGGHIPIESTGKSTVITSEQYVVPEEHLAKYEQLQLEAMAGTAVFFNMNMFHASGTNVSSRIRVTFGARFHRATQGDFQIGREIYTPVQYKD